ncbi:MAG: MOSC domain-containing protein [Bosea sp. (in: a-proteobacteria)]
MTAPPSLGSVAGVYSALTAPGAQPDFVTAATPQLALDLAGIPGDLHAGATRLSGAREPWLPRGTLLRNDRQLSALCRRELAEIASRLGIPALPPEWIGGNLLIDGLPAFSAIAPGSRLAFGGHWGGQGRFDGGAVLRVEGYNLPCRQAGRALARFCDQASLEFAFVKQAARLRGLVLSVDRPGAIAPGDAVVVIPPALPKG